MKKKPRASTTDAQQARVMKMADGGLRSAANVQLATVVRLMARGTIIGVRVTNVGSDLSSVTPMLDDIERRTGRLPAVLLADANHGDHDSIRDAEARGVTALIAVPQSRGGATAGEREENESTDCRMASAHADRRSKTYRARSWSSGASTHTSNRGSVPGICSCGLNKVQTCVVLLTALASNLLAHVNALLAT